MPASCRVLLDGQPVADTGAELAAGVPTVLAGLRVTWGRANTIDQPEAATCSFEIEDRSGALSFLDVFRIGAPIEVHAIGDVATGEPVDVMDDGGFETLTPAGMADRFVGNPVLVDAPTHSGTQALAVATQRVVMPPAAFTPAGNPYDWDSIPPATPRTTWEWSVAVRTGPGVSAIVRPAVISGPQDRTYTLIDPNVTLHPVDTQGEWVTLGNSADIPAGTTGWFGLQVEVTARRTWADQGTAWVDTPGMWRNYGTVWIDDVALMAPATGVMRTALVFAGQITDMDAGFTGGYLGAQITAVDQLADLMNRYVGDVPWPAEPVAARVDKILDAAGLGTYPVTIDAELGNLQLSWRDVDNQPAGGLLEEIATGIDSVLWSATHVTTGPFLWLEEMNARGQVAGLVVDTDTALIVIRPSAIASSRPAGRTVLDACSILREPFRWMNDVSDVITRVDITWLEQLVDDDGQPMPTERTTRILDVDAEARHGVRRYGMSTQLTSAADAIEVAGDLLNRHRQTQWRVNGMEWDTYIAPAMVGDDTAQLLDLLDGAARIGRPLIVENITGWPGADTMGMYLEGGTYSYDGAEWSLTLDASPMAGLGASVTWTAPDPTWTWAMFDRSVRWGDLWGVAIPPVPATEGIEV